VRRREYEAKGVDTDTVQAVQRTHVPFVALDPKKAVGEETVSMADKIRQWAPVGFVYLLWIAIFTISQMLLNNTIEEKSNRIIEVLLSSVTPGELMMGKLGGIAAVGLTMIAAWLLSLFSILQLKAGQEAQLATELLGVLQGGGLLASFVVYFVLGYLLYAGAFLAIGSLCNTLKEAQNMMGPIMIIMIVPLMTMAFIPKEPNGTLATVLSWIPFYTPFVMMNRAAADPPMFDRVGTLILLVATTAFVLWLSGRIFRLGILRTGQPPKLMELVRWLRSG
jgi:ABC-2 type transport system permease protein